jgi:glycosyltransferase involved in cell wall biosynthesis
MAACHSPFLARAIVEFVKPRRRPHILHGFTASTGIAVKAAAVLARSATRHPVVATVWDCMYEESRAKLAGVDPSLGFRGRINPALEVAWNAVVGRSYERRSYGRCQKVFVNYRSIHGLLTSKYGVASERIERLPYASETAFLTPSDSPMPPALATLRAAGVPLIVTMSRHVPRKGLPVLLRALADLRSRGCAFRACFVGGGYLLEHHRRLAGELDLTDVVQLVGRVPESFEYVRHADLFVLPSLEEGSGSLAMLEAMQAGVAIVATRIDGIPEDVRDGEDALLVEPGDVASLAAAIRRVLDDVELRTGLGARAQATFHRRFSADAFTTGLADAYARLT